MSPSESSHNQEAEVKFGWRKQERNGLGPIPLSWGAAPALGWAEQEFGALGILGHFRHLPVLTHPLFFFFFLKMGISQSILRIRMSRSILAKSLEKERQPHMGGISDGSFLHPKWDLGRITFLNVICAGKGPCACWDVLPRTGLSTSQGGGKQEIIYFQGSCTGWGCGISLEEALKTVFFHV